MEGKERACQKWPFFDGLQVSMALAIIHYRCHFVSYFNYGNGRSVERPSRGRGLLSGLGFDTFQSAGD